jgi:hypothetical protein
MIGAAKRFATTVSRKGHQNMMKHRSDNPADSLVLKVFLAGIIFWTLVLLPESAAAYIGPGAGLSAIGIALALVATVALAVVGFLWYPAKRLYRHLFGKSDAGAEPPGSERTGKSPSKPTHS